MTFPTPPHDDIAAAADDDDCVHPSSPAETLYLILHHFLPLLLGKALCARSLVGRWRLLHSKLSILRSSLSDAAAAPASHSNPLFLHFLPSLVPTLRSLRSLAHRCQEPDLPAGKLRLQSDLDVAASALDIHLHDLSVLLRSGLLHRRQSQQEEERQDYCDAAALVLPLPSPSASRADLVLFVRDLFARLQIGGLELKSKALDSLLDLLTSDDAPKLAPLVIEEGNLPLLIRLIDSSAAHYLLRERAAAAVFILATASDASRRAVFEEGALGPLLRLLDAGSASVKERAAAAIHAITADPASAWAVSAYGGVPILVAACRSGFGSPTVRALASGSLKNIVAINDIRVAMFEEGAVPALVDLVLSGNLDAQKNASLCLASLAAMDGEEIRAAILREGGLQRLLQLLREASDSETIGHALRAIHSISVSPLAAKSLSSSPLFFVQLADMIRLGGSASIQQTAASLIASLSPAENIKRSMAGCMATLINIMERSKPANAQETVAGALVSLLSPKSNRKELARDEKSITRLVQMLDPRNDVEKKSVISVVLALTSGSGGGARKRLAEAGACHYLRKLAEAEVAGAKKALQRIAGGGVKNLFAIGGWIQWSQ